MIARAFGLLDSFQILESLAASGDNYKQEPLFLRTALLLRWPHVSRNFNEPENYVLYEK